MKITFFDSGVIRFHTNDSFPYAIKIENRRLWTLFPVSRPFLKFRDIAGFCFRLILITPIFLLCRELCDNDTRVGNFPITTIFVGESLNVNEILHTDFQSINFEYRQTSSRAAHALGRQPVNEKFSNDLKQLFFFLVSYVRSKLPNCWDANWRIFFYRT